MLGLIYIDGGDIQIFGKNVKDIKPEDKEQIGVVLSDSGFSRYLTVKDIKDILKNTYEAFDEQLFTNYIEKYQLPTDKKLEQFSVGMKAKLKLITAICHKAKLLILDEPCNGMDILSREFLLKDLQTLLEEKNMALIYVTHHTDEILPFFNKALLLKNGEEYKQGAIKDVFTESNLKDFFEVPINVSWSDNNLTIHMSDI